jgi:hypothetical protein
MSCHVVWQIGTNIWRKLLQPLGYSEVRGSRFVCDVGIMITRLLACCEEVSWLEEEDCIYHQVFLPITKMSAVNVLPTKSVFFEEVTDCPTNEK